MLASRRAASTILSSTCSSLCSMATVSWDKSGIIPRLCERAEERARPGGPGAGEGGKEAKMLIVLAKLVRVS